MFNLGWIFQTGWGVSQDFERAKVRISIFSQLRLKNLSVLDSVLTITGILQEYYSKCMDASSEARVPAFISLKAMYVDVKYKVCVFFTPLSV